MELLNIFLTAALLLLLRKLVWCLRWLWCYYHGRETPAPIALIPRRTGDTFAGHVRQAREESASCDTKSE